MFLDLAVRDVEISLGAFALAKLTGIREFTSLASGSTERAGVPENQRVVVPRLKLYVAKSGIGGACG
jgi:hypothetical protein